MDIWICIDISLNICYILGIRQRGRKPRLPRKIRKMAFKLEEKRRFPRIKLKTPLRYQIRGAPDFDNVTTNDISQGGISFVSDKFISPATLLMLEINVLSRILRPIGKVVCAQPLPHSDRNRLGIEFLEFNPEEKNYLQDYVKLRMGQL